MMRSNYFLKGMDVSFLDEIEQSGGVFREEGEEKDCLAILQDSGVNAIRLRIWNNPPGGYCNLERTLLMARRIKERGFHFLLDFHYSDKWADPANQWKPQAWEALDYEGLRNAVARYTGDVLEALKHQHTLPDMVQIGNEVTPGMLWDDGKVGGEGFDTDEQWVKFTGLLKSGIEAAKAVDPSIRIMIHIDRGGDHAASRWFMDRMVQHEVDYDVLGQSYYPWWHGTLEDLRSNLNDLSARYGKELLVVETAYPWTIEEKDGLSCIVNKPDQLHAGYPATIEGQSRYLRDLIQLIKEVPGDMGIGFYWWEPAWIPSKPDWSVGHGNNWSNLTLFDYTGGKLPSLDVCRVE